MHGIVLASFIIRKVKLEYKSYYKISALYFISI